MFPYDSMTRILGNLQHLRKYQYLNGGTQDKHIRRKRRLHGKASEEKGSILLRNVGRQLHHQKS
jgi:hypothetical protein